MRKGVHVYLPAYPHDASLWFYSLWNETALPQLGFFFTPTFKSPYFINIKCRRAFSHSFNGGLCFGSLCLLRSHVTEIGGLCVLLYVRQICYFSFDLPRQESSPYVHPPNPPTSHTPLAVSPSVVSPPVSLWRVCTSLISHN